ncbi:unnamed protein product [Effrenium voratum]|uniref:Signal peptidase complex subunit 1 n=1 Tax=Effrenium voratum TaxID=2562239 RepID=A0AA36MWR5_9DINO|nr:unnamed protein product [Effrenium voratum]CAJ1432949.1 unnamed protein product [Effrenium voratum]|mmetsp:Transcript_51043/g.122152  ORF Transcript_51043/g.122152 Transcript_51043/m.122152 type:complete len:117 (-) Transcript_51043:42-392(-)
MVGVMELIAMIRAGSMDFVGQKQAFNMQFYCIWTSGVIGFIHGFFAHRFLYTFAWIFGTSAIVGLLCVPPWPMWNRHPVAWLVPKDEDEEPKEPKAKKQESSASAKKNAKGSKKKN